LLLPKLKLPQVCGWLLLSLTFCLRHWIPEGPVPPCLSSWREQVIQQGYSWLINRGGHWLGDGNKYTSWVQGLSLRGCYLRSPHLPEIKHRQEYQLTVCMVGRGHRPKGVAQTGGTGRKQHSWNPATRATKQLGTSLQ
jgi:hypothetical protein